MEIPEAVRALIVGLPSFGLGYLAYRRSLRVDSVAAQAGAATESRAGTQQIIDGLNDGNKTMQAINDALQEDNAVWRSDLKDVRTDLRDLTGRFAEMSERLVQVMGEREGCRTELIGVKKELVRLKVKYGENGNRTE